MYRYSATKDFDPDVYELLMSEENRLRTGINLIPSENYSYPEVIECLGSVFTDKYSEGYPGKKYYGGNEFNEGIENLARDRAKQIFGAEHANVQPLSGSPMNQAVYLAFMKPGDTILGMDLSHGGHLTHGAPVSHMGKLFNFTRYKTYPDQDGRIDFDELLKLAREVKPKIVLCGYTSYPRDYDYTDFKKVADEVGAITMADVSHIGGLIAGGAMRNPLDYGFDIITLTTHKTLRGPRGGMILCKKEFAKEIDKSVFPGLQGGPHMNNICALAVALKKAQQPEFKDRAKQVMGNSKAMAKGLMDRGAKLITDGTDNHMMVMDCMTSFGVDGTDTENILGKANIFVNKQVIPDDPLPPLRPSGIRLGSPAATSRGLKEEHMDMIANWIVVAIENKDDENKLKEIGEEINQAFKDYPVSSLVRKYE